MTSMALPKCVDLVLVENANTRTVHTYGKTCSSLKSSTLIPLSHASQENSENLYSRLCVKRLCLFYVTVHVTLLALYMTNANADVPLYVWIVSSAVRTT